MALSSFKSMSSRYVIFFFIFFLFLGLIIHRDYGVSFDEPTQRFIGQVNLNHIAKFFHLKEFNNSIEISASLSPLQLITSDPLLSQTNTSLAELKDRDYGVIYELPAVLLEYIFNLKNERDIYFARHLLNFLFFFAGVVAVYKMAKRRYFDWRIGILAATFLIISPRFFAESFYNSKDLVFLSVFAIALNTEIAFILQPNLRKAIIHGFATAVAIDTRIMGIIILVSTLIVLTLLLIKKECPRKYLTMLGAVYLILSAAIIVALWPFLWDSPISNFIQVFSNMAHFRHNPYIIFMGESIRASSLPWFYLLTWIGITTPPLYLALFLVGFLSTIKFLFCNGLRLWKNESQLQDLIFLFSCIAPIAAIIFLHSVLYNGWRHAYFIYPAFILITIVGFIQILHSISRIKIWLGRLFILLVIALLSHTAYWMIINHPFQNLYFNFFAGNWNKRYEVDYWGVNNRAVLEKIISNDKFSNFIIWPGLLNQWPGGWQLPYGQNIRIMNDRDQNRITIANSLGESEYVISSKLANDKSNTDLLEFDYRFKEVDSIKIDGNAVYTIFKKIDNPILPPIKIGEKIEFSKNKSGIYYLDGNWQGQEPWGTWSSGRNGKLFFPMPEDKPKDLKLIVRALVSNKLPKQLVEIWINGHLEKTVDFNRPYENEIDISLQNRFYKRNALEIELKFPNASRPIDLGMNDDNRLLAIGLESIEFR